VNAKSSSKNDYRCAMEISQNGKYNVRIRANFGTSGWKLPVYFQASSFDAAMKKLESTLHFLQRHEDRLWFWGVERSDDPKFAGDLLEGFGLSLDHRTEFPLRAAAIAVAHERTVPAVSLAPLRRSLAESISGSRTALASD
jgi:hypothetical protein